MSKSHHVQPRHDCLVSLYVAADSTKVVLVGHGLTIDEPFELSDGVRLLPPASLPLFDDESSAAPRLHDYAAVVTGQGLASIGIEICDNSGAQSLTGRAWNALRLFPLLEIASDQVCFSLYAVSEAKRSVFTSASRIQPVVASDSIRAITKKELEWCRGHVEDFVTLAADARFSFALRCQMNAPDLLDPDMRIMLLWAGIEGLLGVDSELSRRLALYAALMFPGTRSEKDAYFTFVKKTYGLRSKAVHGARIDNQKLLSGYIASGSILRNLMKRCIALKRVPTPAELDALALSGEVS